MMDIITNEEKTSQIDFEKVNQRNFNNQINPSKNPETKIALNASNQNSSKEQMFLPIAVLNSEYYLLKKLGSGSSGCVYLSYSKLDQNKTLYAIKLIPKTVSNFDFMNSCEVNYLSKINHKNILKVHLYGTGQLQYPNGLTQQVYYIIMDYLDHGSLLAQVKNNIGLGEDFGRLIFAQLLDGLEAIHNSNIVHRDIKLENIMISGNDYSLKYIDFGFATEKSNEYLSTFLGTPNYAAPELHLKQKYLGVYEDIFSLGVTLFILVTGHLPFLLPLPNDILYRYIFCLDYVNYWRKRNVKVSPSFMELFDNLIAFDPSQRPSISEIRKCKWMQEINWGLKDQLKNELIRREQLNDRNNLIRGNIRRNEINARNDNCNMKNNNNCNNNTNNKNNTADDILAKIEEKKKIELVNDIKKQLFPVNIQKNVNNKEDIGQNDEQSTKTINNKNNNLNGFIQINANIKNLNSLMTLLRGFFKNEGYNVTKRDLNNAKMEISNGEVDVCISFEKMYKIIKISFYIINGNKEDLINFKKIMKKINMKEG